MSTARADAKKRIVIRTAKPGEVFDIQRQDDELSPGHSNSLARARG